MIIELDKFLKSQNIDKSRYYYEIMEIVNTMVDNDFFIEKNKVYLTTSGVEKLQNNLHVNTPKKDIEYVLEVKKILGKDYVRFPDIYNLLDLSRKSLNEIPNIAIYEIGNNTSTSLKLILKDDIPKLYDYATPNLKLQLKPLKYVKFKYDSESLEIIDVITFNSYKIEIYKKNDKYYIPVSILWGLFPQYKRKIKWICKNDGDIEYLITDELFNRDRKYIKISDLPLLYNKAVEKGTLDTKVYDNLKLFINEILVYANNHNIIHLNPIDTQSSKDTNSIISPEFKNSLPNHNIIDLSQIINIYPISLTEKEKIKTILTPIVDKFVNNICDILVQYTQLVINSNCKNQTDNKPTPLQSTATQLDVDEI